MRTFAIFVTICAGLLASGTGAYGPGSLVSYPPRAVLDFHPDPLMLAIRDVESAGGKRCGIGSAGELTCWQIKSSTATWSGCDRGWDSRADGALARSCARSVLEKGRALCARNDTAGLAQFYNDGDCMGWRDKPSGYALDVLDRLRRYL